MLKQKHQISVLTLTKQQQQQVLDRTEACVQIGREHFDRTFAPVPVQFDLTGRCAGQYRFKQGKHEIRYNPYIFARYFADSIDNTVPHEVAHFLVHQMYPRRRLKPHGVEWVAVMQVLGAEPTRTGDYDISGLPQRRQQRFAYQCACREHDVSATRHNRMQAGAAIYLCRFCQAPLNLTTEF